MTNEQWDTCQKLIDAGLIEAALPSMKNEIVTALSDEQLSKLGDLDTAIRNMLSTTMPVRKQIAAIIELARNCIIKAKDYQ